jgi:hypothetical protein
MITEGVFPGYLPHEQASSIAGHYALQRYECLVLRTDRDQQSSGN